MPATIRDVAKAAGVTIGTVSRVFNNYPDVLPETRVKVLRAAEALSYTPNVNARSLSLKRPPNLCFIAYGLLNSDTRDSNVFGYLRGILRYTVERGIELEFYSTDAASQDSSRFSAFCKQHGVSGAIVSGLNQDDLFLRDLTEGDIPVVGIDLPLSGSNAGWVSIDNRSAAREGAAAFLAQGPDHPLIIAGKRNTAVNAERIAGVADAFAAAGYRFSGEDLLEGDFDEEKARVLAVRHLKAHPETDGVFCFSDLMAIGVMRAARELGLRIPEDLSVMGFDGAAFGEMVTPSLSTVQQDFAALGFEAASLADDLMHDRTETERHRIAPHRVILRDSTRHHPGTHGRRSP